MGSDNCLDLGPHKQVGVGSNDQLRVLARRLRATGNGRERVLPVSQAVTTIDPQLTSMAKEADAGIRRLCQKLSA